MYMTAIAEERTIDPSIHIAEKPPTIHENGGIIDANPSRRNSTTGRTKKNPIINRIRPPTTRLASTRGS